MGRGFTHHDAHETARHNAGSSQQGDRQHHEWRLHLLRVHVWHQQSLARKTQDGVGCGASQNLGVDGAGARYAQLLQQEADDVLLGAHLGMVQVVWPRHQLAFGGEEAGEGALQAPLKEVSLSVTDVLQGQLQGQG